jgi:hypothetical protein
MSTILLFLGVVLTLIGGIWIIIEAFKESIVWGICSLIIPLVALIFALMHLDRTKRALIIYVVGLVLAFLGVSMGGGVSES